MTKETVKESIARLETLLGEWPKEEEIVTAFTDSINNELEVHSKLIELSDQYAGERICKTWEKFNFSEKW